MNVDLKKRETELNKKGLEQHKLRVEMEAEKAEREQEKQEWEAQRQKLKHIIDDRDNQTGLLKAEHEQSPYNRVPPLQLPAPGILDFELKTEEENQLSRLEKEERNLNDLADPTRALIVALNRKRGEGD